MLPWIEVYEHFNRGQQAFAGDLMWQVQIRLLPHMKPNEQNAVLNQIRELQQAGKTPAQSVYEQCENREDRMRLIGSALDTGGQEWLDSHPQQIYWLREQGISVADCLNEFHRYYERESQFELFRPARNKSRQESVVVGQ